MHNQKEEIKKLLKESGALQRGEFILASGAKSDYYLDLRLIPNFPETFKKLTSFAVKYIKTNCSEFQGVVGIPLAGIPFATMIASQLNKPFYILRKEPKKYGLKRMIEGEIKKGQKILLVDDVISSGFSKVFAINSLRREGAVVEDLFVFISRVKNGLIKFENEQQIKVHYLIDIKDILLK
jgi:orotate phosphoribosyltransferase